MQQLFHTLNGRDRLLRLVQYLARYLALRGHSKDAPLLGVSPAQWSQVASNISFCRRVFFLGKFVDTWRACLAEVLRILRLFRAFQAKTRPLTPDEHTLQLIDVVSRLLEVLKLVQLGLWLFCDTIQTVVDLGTFRLGFQARLSLLSSRLWLSYLVTSLSQQLFLRIFVNHQFFMRLKDAGQGAYTGHQFSPVDTLRNALDFPLPSQGLAGLLAREGSSNGSIPLGPDWRYIRGLDSVARLISGAVGPRGVAACGIASSCVAVYQTLWP
ncbi:hypothetical protein H696_03870 [Fonticula alba]|uniref:Uncharacterized protein n=1 Tax=Fonticula alba TaxID=691883 RepID=A0A058Z5R2_FONAL|nr:hypothetical protein H696_03870 [Fonticula alba]KCV69441.1 hypothetical protein H696_03870 [Fonticula alba]|eukprot:XP_009496006.1 hypothetical protein H696_03870 [Fonticula alba]